MTPNNDTLLLAELRRDEGVRLKPYRDTVGKLTIGVGRNLDDVGISDSEAGYLLLDDVAKLRVQLDKALPWWRSLDPVRARVIQNMAFNLGVEGLLEFRNTLSAVQAKDWPKAAAGMLASRWAGQVGTRAERLADMMLKGSA